MVKLNQSLDSRVTNLERVVADIKSNQVDSKKLSSAVENLVNSIEQGHFCKWNVEMGKVIEANENTKEARKGILKTLENHKVAIDKINENLDALVVGKRIMTQIKNEQVSQKATLSRDRKNLFIGLGVIVATTLSGRIFDVMVWILHLHP